MYVTFYALAKPEAADGFLFLVAECWMRRPGRLQREREMGPQKEHTGFEREGRGANAVASDENAKYLE